MFDSITIENLPHLKKGQKIDKLKRINIFYGNNGTGKSTLCRELERRINDGNSDGIKVTTSIKLENMRSLKFDTNFVSEVMVTANKMAGLYTFGNNIQADIQLTSTHQDKKIMKKEFFYSKLIVKIKVIV